MSLADGGAFGVPVTTYEYDGLGRTSRIIDPLGRITEYVYAADDSYVTVNQRDSVSPFAILSSTTMNYDELGRMESTVDPLGNVTSMVYDVLGRVSETILPDADGVSPTTDRPEYGTTYDALGRTKTTTSALGGVTTYLYSNYGQTIEVRQPQPASGVDVPAQRSYRNEAGQVTRVVDGYLPGSSPLPQPKSGG